VPGRLAAALASLRRGAHDLSLRARLLLGLLLLAAVGLVAADVVVYGQVESFLTSQVDQQVKTSLNPFLRQVYSLLNVNSGFGGPGFGGALDFRQDTPRGTYGAIVYGHGTILTQIFQGSTPLGPRPAVPGDIVTRTETSLQSISTPFGDAHDVDFTVGAVGDPGFQYRLIAVPLNTTTPSVALVAIPLADLDAVLHHLVGIDLLASAAVLVLLLGLGYVVVRVGMRPLVDIERTAGAIAAGDLSRRVARDEPTTEVGRLGASLNTMLGQIEHAFAEQQRSEARLRQFLADASHELRTPVTSIRGYSELFRRGAANRPEDLALAMRRIEDEAVRMGLLVDDLLLLARLDQGRPLEHVAVDLVALAADAAADAQVLAPDREITFDAPGPVVVTGDEQALRQVVTNLVQNALRYTPDASPIAIAVRAVEHHGELVVRDEGPGMTSEHAARVFERFYRADPSRTRGSGGTGLGLSIVQSIALAHGGSVRLDTAPGEGATFTVELPLRADSADGRPDAAPRGGTASAPGRAAAPAEGSGAQRVEVRGVVEAPERLAVAVHDDARDGGVVHRDEGERP
jgi:two-component system OmpR family sensor kinase